MIIILNNLNFHSHPCKVNKIITTFDKKSDEMIVERDIVGFALPFTFGIGISVCFFQHFSHCPSICATIALTLAALEASFLLYSRHKHLSSSLIWTCIIVSALCTGYLCAITETMTSLSGNPASPISTSASGAAESLKGLISRTFGNIEGKHLITALITGDRSGLSTHTIEIFRKSGASHILALSGLHLGIIYAVLKGMSSAAGNSRISKVVRSVLVISICGFYTLATGASASITRAMLFILLGEAASLTGRHRSTAGILWPALLIQLVTDPLVITDIGFQLSYAAMFGIAYIYPHLKKIWPGKMDGEGIVSSGLRWIWNSAAMSIACQITTGPIAWIYFRAFPTYFLITNMIAIPITGLIIPSCLLAMILECLGICPDLLISAIDTSISVLVQSLEIIASL
jgi:competence protein ComEC